MLLCFLQDLFLCCATVLLLLLPAAPQQCQVVSQQAWKESFNESTWYDQGYIKNECNVTLCQLVRSLSWVAYRHCIVC